MIPVLMDTIEHHFHNFVVQNNGAIAIVLGSMATPEDWPYLSEAVVDLPLGPLDHCDITAMRHALSLSPGVRQLREICPLPVTSQDSVRVWSPQSRVHCAMLNDAPPQEQTKESAEVFRFDISAGKSSFLKAAWEIIVCASTVEVRFCSDGLLMKKFKQFREGKNVAFAHIVRDLWRNARDIAKVASPYMGCIVVAQAVCEPQPTDASLKGKKRRREAVESAKERPAESAKGRGPTKKEVREGKPGKKGNDAKNGNDPKEYRKVNGDAHSGYTPSASSQPGRKADPLMSQFGNSLRMHYNEKTQSMVPANEDLMLGGVRKFNNLIKQIVIRLVPNTSVVLDLACGHGQDLLKYMHTQKPTLQYVGLDSSDSAIAEGTLRYRKLKSKKLLNFAAEFFVRDVRDAQAFTFTPNSFQFVCCNFALHYILHSEAEAWALLSKVRTVLASDGIFAVTIVCSSVLEYRLRERGPKFGNRAYEVVFDNAELPLNWGRRYDFRLGAADGRDGSINHSEFVVPHRALCELAIAAGLDVVVDAGFPDMFLHHYTKSGAVSDWYSNSSSLDFSEDEGDIASLYRVIMFKKR